jgi:hypothetical protein
MNRPPPNHGKHLPRANPKGINLPGLTLPISLRIPTLILFLLNRLNIFVGFDKLQKVLGIQNNLITFINAVGTLFGGWTCGVQDGTYAF